MDEQKLAQLQQYYETTDLSEEIKVADLAGAAPTSSSEPMDAFTVRLPRKVLGHFREVAVRRGLTTGEVIRMALEDAAAAAADDSRTVTVRQLRALIATAD